mgnify:CR=1 FL=1
MSDYPPNVPTNDMVQLPINMDLAQTGAPNAVLIVIALTFIVIGLVVIFCKSRD